MSPYEAYGEAARQLATPAIMSGRHTFQASSETPMVADVVEKLRLDKSCRLLEVGCGIGTVLRPIATHVAKAVGVDHPSCLFRFEQLGKPANVSLVPGEWPNVEITDSFDRILVYAVLQYLSGEPAARAFIAACIVKLRPGGGLLLGDIPNEDARHRFVTSSFGRGFQAQWAKQTAAKTEEQILAGQIFARVGPRPPFLNDAFVLGLLADARREGLESYVVPQPADLPFCYSREDVLIWKRL